LQHLIQEYISMLPTLLKHQIYVVEVTRVVSSEIWLAKPF